MTRTLPATGWESLAADRRRPSARCRQYTPHYMEGKRARDPASGAPSVPVPLVRVEVGTTVNASMTNRRDVPAVVYGLHDHDGRADSVILAPSESRRDPLGARVRGHERVMVVTAFDDTVKASGFPNDHFQVFAINGLSWPRSGRFLHRANHAAACRHIHISHARRRADAASRGTLRRIHRAAQGHEAARHH